MTDEEKEPYKVGYGKPPKEHQVKPGERKNPFGRPAGSGNAKKIVRAEHKRLLQLTEKGRTRRKPAIELIIRRDVADALRGVEKAKARQIGLGLQMAEEDEARAALKSQKKTMAEDAEILARYLPSERVGSGSSNDE